MIGKLEELVALQRELDQVLKLVSLQLAVASKVITTEIPKAAELFARMQQVSAEILAVEAEAD